MTNQPPSPKLRITDTPPPSSLRPSNCLAGQVPVLPGTLLGLELMLFRPALDLRSVSRLLCADPGALLHLFAALAEETERLPDTPCRIEDCIASLPLDRLLERLVRAGAAHHDHAPVVAFARHSVAISRHAQLVATSLDLSAEHAAQVGLLHDLGTLPWILGWSSVPPTPAQAALSCEQLSLEYSLPLWLRHALISLHHGSPDSLWTVVVDAAHELSQHQVSPA